MYLGGTASPLEDVRAHGAFHGLCHVRHADAQAARLAGEMCIRDRSCLSLPFLGHSLDLGLHALGNVGVDLKVLLGGNALGAADALPAGDVEELLHVGIARCV